ncbi:MAG: hypothetical protein NHF87_00300 [Candidatus Shikimatogenerans bostrichidophilus]|nr:MAG: hypothetical protein NHF87_00300 [Candidatus Shikimatogenerans bostrichidophilus]
MIEKEIKIMNTLKQKKFSNIIKNYLNKLFLIENKKILITVLYVYINKIFSYSKIYTTIYPDIYKKKFNSILNKKKIYYKNKLSIIFKNKFRIPDINFYLSNDKILEFINYY